jgi:hypothetical protein
VSPLFLWTLFVAAIGAALVVYLVVSQVGSRLVALAERIISRG